MKTGIELIAEERKEQIEKHGYDEENDSSRFHVAGELRQAAVFCLTENAVYYPVGWDSSFSRKLLGKSKRMTKKAYTIERLKIAGALCAAEIDRIQQKGEVLR